MEQEDPYELAQPVQKFGDEHEHVGKTIQAVAQETATEAQGGMIVVNGRLTLSQAIEETAETLVEHPEIKGVWLEENRKIVGWLSVEAIEQYADQFEIFRNDPRLYGDNLSDPDRFVCPKEGHNYSEVISSYDFNDPPRCPVHDVKLVRE